MSEPVTCITCARKTDPDKWPDIGYECSHLECPHRKVVTAAPPARDWDSSPQDGTVRPLPPHE